MEKQTLDELYKVLANARETLKSSSCDIYCECGSQEKYTKYKEIEERTIKEIAELTGKDPKDI